MASHKRGDEVWRAIAHRDVVSLRKMAANAATDEGRMWMTLLARMLELDANRKRRQQQRVTRPIVGASMPSREIQRRADQS